MITLSVHSLNGLPAADAPSATFDELGGTIGRAEGNLMVLPDPERTISRVHAKVVFRNGQYAIEDRGSNPILVNGNLVAVPVRFAGSRAEAAMDMGGIDLLTVRDSKIVEVHLFSEDAATEDAFWGRN